MRGSSDAGVPVLAVLALSLCVAAPAAAAGTTSVDWRLRLAAGVDSNPLRVADDGPDGTFATLSFDGTVSTRVSRAHGWFASVRLADRRFDDDADLGDRSYARLKTGWTVRPPVRRFAAAFGATYELARSTYVDRETGTRQQIDDGAGGRVDVGDRYDRDIGGLFFDARYRSSDRTRLVLRTSLERSDFRADYRASAGLDPLDATTLTIRPELRIAFGAGVDLAVGVERAVVEYDARPALDEGGSAVPGVDRRYEYTELTARLRYEPGDDWSLRLGARARDRADVFAGYYDYDGVSAWAAVERALGPRGELTLYGSLGSTSYDTATVSSNGQDEPRGADVTRWLARYRHRLSDRIAVYAEGGRQREADRDPIYAHDRTWTSVGLEFRR